MAKEDWLEILGWDEKSLEDIRLLAYSYIKQGIYDVALQFFEALSVLSTPTSYDLQTLGALHLQMGSALKALDFLDKALKQNPDHAITKLNRAKALFMLGYKRQGIKELQELSALKLPKMQEKIEALLLAYT